MHKRKLFCLAIVIGLVVAWYIPDCFAGDVIRKAAISPKGEITAMSYTCVEKLPSKYNPEGKINPFITMAQWDAIDNPRPVETNLPEIVKIPDTILTRWGVQQYNLTGVVIGETFRWAFFTSEAAVGRAYKGVEGDFIGRDGVKIVSINKGNVSFSDGNNMTKSAW